MAKKTLNEATIRRFQKLANLAPINETYYMSEEEEEEAEMGGEELAPADAPEAEEAEMDDMGAEEPAEMDGDLELTDEEAEAIIALGNKLEAAMGMDDEMGDMDIAGEEAELPADDAAADDISDETLQEALRGISYVPSQKEIVNEVAQRVARRLKAAKLHEAKLNKALGKKR